ncbi:ATP-binding cassette domain-containing protein [Microbacterium halotolerans]|uniref:ATP-binding cassette domain-containing protein n=1 Tax=Microbacterium halotolerans TaxID=246613 RepID=UPI00196968CF|nr:ATP-binding cassette domain-containing protein [Microbacterium halotolerans]
MADGKVLEFSGVTKVFGDVSAVSDLTARVEPGVVTAVLGPNGAGKTTSLRILLGEIRPSSGKATIGGATYSSISHPARTVGAVLETPTFKQRRTATRQLTSVAKSNGIPLPRVREVLDLVGLSDVADMRIASYSLGMRQRLSIAQSLLGDPGVLIFDEPVNGMDPEGIRWMRLLMRRLADEGRTVLMSSHLLSEVQQIADRILIVSNGKLVFSGDIEDLADVDPIVVVDSPDREKLSRVLREGGYEFEVLRSGVNVRDARARDLGKSAAEAGIALSVLHQRGASLEDVFLDLVNGRPTRQTAALPSRKADTTGAVGAAAAVQGEASDAGAAVAGEAPNGADVLSGAEENDYNTDHERGSGMGAAVAGAATGVAGAAAGAAAVGIAGAAPFGDNDAQSDDAALADRAHDEDAAAEAAADDDGFAGETHADDEDDGFGPADSRPGFDEHDGASEDVHEGTDVDAEGTEEGTTDSAEPDHSHAAPSEEVDEAHPDSRPLPGADRLAHLLNDNEDSTREIPTFPLLGAPTSDDGQDETSSDADQHGSPWSAGPSFADRLGSTAGDDEASSDASGSDAPAPEDENSSRLSQDDLSDPDFVALGETEPISHSDRSDLGDGEQHGEAAEGDEPVDGGAESAPATQEISFESFVSEFHEDDSEQQ